MNKLFKCLKEGWVRANQPITLKYFILMGQTRNYTFYSYMSGAITRLDWNKYKAHIHVNTQNKYFCKDFDNAVSAYNYLEGIAEFSMEFD